MRYAVLAAAEEEGLAPGVGVGVWLLLPPLVLPIVSASPRAASTATLAVVSTALTGKAGEGVEIAI